MNGIGVQLAQARRRAGLTQVHVAERMGTTQSALSRVESGWTSPSFRFIERYARAVGGLTLRIGGAPERDDRRARVRRVLGDYVFDPWRRNPSPAEAMTLEQDGLGRERFQKPGRPRGGREPRGAGTT